MLKNALKSWDFILNHPVNRSHRARAIREIIGWQIGSRLLPGDVIYPWIDNTRFIVRPGETGLTGNIYTGLHEFADMAYVLHILRSGDLFVDVGANVGSYTLLASAVAGAHTVAFEPVPDSYERLSANVQLNGIDDLVRCLGAAVGARAGKVTFTVDEGPMNHVVAASEGDRPNIIVPLTTLDEVLEDEQPVMLKIDVEGYESEVLTGAEQTLQKASLNSILFEDNGSSNRYATDTKSPHAILLDAGFREYTYSPMDRTLKPGRDAASHSGNVLMIRDIELARQIVGGAPHRRIKEQRI